MVTQIGTAQRNKCRFLLTGRVCVHDRLHVVAGEAELVPEEQRPDERQLLEVLQGDGVLQQLPLGLQGEELVDKLFGIGQEVVVVVLVPVKNVLMYNLLN